MISFRVLSTSGHFTGGWLTQGEGDGVNGEAPFLEAETDVSNEVLNAAEFGLGCPQEHLIKLDFFEGQVQQVFDPSLLLCEVIAFGPCVLKEFLLLRLEWWWSISHVIVDL